jgi:putative ABC transport system permease protein
MSVDYDFLQTFEMLLVAGRSFSKDYGTDPSSAFIVNETAVREFSWDSPEAAIGKDLTREGKKGKVIGVIRDFNFTSLETAVSAMVIEFNPDQFNTLSIRLKNADIPQVVGRIESMWNRMFPEKSFEHTFLDQQINDQYTNYRNFGVIIQAFTLVAILISCLGVYGLVLFVVQRKVKEIGVRKVLGATMGNILRMIFRDFAGLIVIGFALAIPLSYYLMDAWLKNFTYHTSIDVLTYFVSLVMLVTIVALTIGYQAVKASLANPVRSLRSE